jgi:hypothetical protein
MSRVKTALDRPYPVSFAIRSASRSLRARTIVITGPAISSLVLATFSCASSTCGGSSSRAGPSGSPPSTWRAPSARARSTASRIAVSRRAVPTGPMSVSAAAGSPARKQPASVSSRSVNSEYTFRCTVIRRVIMQIWSCPAKEPNTAASTARARSASSRTTNDPSVPGWPTSRLPAAPRASTRPVAADPANEMTRGTGCPVIASLISGPEATTTLSSPAGRPASRKILASSSPPVTGLSLDGLRTTAFPAASAAAVARLDSSIGKLAGLITAITPAGTRQTRVCRPGRSDGTMRPVT